MKTNNPPRPELRDREKRQLEQRAQPPAKPLQPPAMRRRDAEATGLRHRFIGLEPGAIDEKARTIKVSFSSETRAVTAWHWDLGQVPEILSHGREACDLSPLINAGSVLLNHDGRIPVAVPLAVSIDSEARRGQATIHFPEGDADAERAWTKVRTKLIRGVSVGFDIAAEEYVKAGCRSSQGHEGPCIVATRWIVHEISLTPIPADSSVGVGRARVKTPASNGGAKMEPKVIRAMVRAAGLPEKYADTLCARESKDADEVAAEISAEREKRAKASNKRKLVGAGSGASRETREAEGDDEGEAGDDEGEEEERETEPQAPRSIGKGLASIELERERQREIRSAVRAANLPAELADDLCDKGTSLDKARAVIIKKLAENDTSAASAGGRGRVDVAQDMSDKRWRHWEANLSRRANPGLVDDPDYKGVEREHVTLMSITRDYLHAIGTPGLRAMGNEEAVRTFFNMRTKFRAGAANVTGDLSSLLANIQNKALMRAYQLAKPTWRTWCKKGSLSDFKIAKRIELSDFAQLRETGENGEILDSKLSDRGENIQLAYFARAISLTWEMFINDDMNALNALPAWMGRSAAQLPSRLVYAHLMSGANGDGPTMSDGVQLFHLASHGNYQSGATTALDETNAVDALKAALVLFRRQTAPKAPNDTDFPAESIDLEPRIILVPPELEFEANKLANPNLYMAETQFFKGKFQVEVEPRLSNIGYAGYSAAAWYLMAEAAVADNMECAFLDGNENPRTDAWEDFNVLALKYRCILPCGVKALSWRGMVRSKGAA